jgi:hypothetical protein
MKYLIDRKKVGSILLPNCIKLFVLPVMLIDGNSALYLAAPEPTAPVYAIPNLATEIHKSKYSISSSAPALQTACSKATTGSSSSNVNAAPNFLASIMNKVCTVAHTTTLCLVLIISPVFSLCMQFTAQTKVLAKSKAAEASIKLVGNMYAELENHAKERLQAFVSDTSLTMLEFEPMTKDNRAVM